MIYHSEGGFIYGRCLKTKSTFLFQSVQRPAREAPCVLQATAQGCELPSHFINHQAKAASGRRCWWVPQSQAPCSRRFADRWGSSPISPAKYRSGSRQSLQSQPCVSGINTPRKGGMMCAVCWPCWQGRDHQGTAGEITLQPVLCQKMPQSHGLKNSEEVSLH